MASGYRIYSNQGVGDVDYATPVASVGKTTFAWTSAALAYPATHIYAVRAFNSYGEEPNCDVRGVLILNAGGLDATQRPNTPVGIQASASASGKVTLTWAYDPAGAGLVATSFKVYGDGGSGTVNYASAAATITAAGGPASYAWTSAALTHGTTYRWGVRARSTSGIEDGNSIAASAVADSSAPTQPASLTATATR
jgi:hypothetical protein